MNNIIKKGIYAGTTLTTALYSTAFAIDPKGGGTIQGGIQGSPESADSVVQTWIGNALGFLYIVAVIYGLWGGFNILTAGGDDEKVKKGKTIIINALIGIVVIFLASSIVEWLLKIINGQ